MRRSAFAILFAIALAACTQQGSVSVQSHANDEAWLSRNAGADPQAALQLGKYYCEHEPAGSGNPKAIAAWEKTIAVSEAHPEPHNDNWLTASAMEQLGMLYLSFYEDPDGPFNGKSSFDPEKDKLHAYCTGRKAGHTDFAAAEKWLTGCAADKYDNSLFADSGACKAALGHLYARYKHYAKAYYWYGMLLAASLQTEYYTKGQAMPPFSADDPLLHKPDFNYAELSNLKRMASHLSKSEVAKLNHAVTVSQRKRLRLWLNGGDAFIRQRDAGRSD